MTIKGFWIPSLVRTTWDILHHSFDFAQGRPLKVTLRLRIERALLRKDNQVIDFSFVTESFPFKHPFPQPSNANSKFNRNHFSFWVDNNRLVVYD